MGYNFIEQGQILSTTFLSESCKWSGVIYSVLMESAIKDEALLRETNCVSRWDGGVGFQWEAWYSLPCFMLVSSV